MSDDKGKKEQFLVLLQQLQMTEDAIVQHFEHAQLQKVVVDKELTKYHFHFLIEKILPANIFSLLAARLQRTFSYIAKTSTFSLQVRDHQFQAETAQDYWNLCLQEIDGMSPPTQKLLHEQVPKINGNKIIITARNEPEGQSIKKKHATVISDIYQSFGFPLLVMDIEVSHDTKEVENFIKAKEKEDQEKAFLALVEMQKKDADKEKGGEGAPQGPLTVGLTIKDNSEFRRIEEINEEERRVAVQGYVFDAETKELRSGRTLLTFKITDYTSSIMVKMFSRDKEDAALFQHVKKGMWLKVRGSVQNDTFVRDLVMIGNDLNEVKPVERKDTAPEDEKRVELHLHTPMSQMDAVTPVGALIAQAKRWGHKAIAVTDHAVVQSFPEAFGAGKKNDIKILFGVEVNLVDDGVPIAYNDAHRLLADDTFVVFDVETTGLSSVYDTIIELAAVKIRGGEVIDRFESFINPHHKLSATTINLTGITDDLVESAPEEAEVIKRFYDWAEDGILVAHNATFDMGFLNVGYKNIGLGKATNPVIDTLELARFLFPGMKNHRLNTLAKKLEVELTQHHRAIYDAEATGYILLKMLKDATEKGIEYHDQFNDHMGQGNAFQRARPYHCSLLVQNEIGLKNLFKLVSISQIHYFYRVPRIPRSQLQKYREGILVGSACDKGEVFEGMMQKGFEVASELARFYDYLEVQPKEVYAHLLEMEL
ncbi:MAG: polC, partial [Bacillus sp. (in: firmicutes)]|nr:polC [Bacillus sp. (in: firmicutes)]